MPRPYPAFPASKRSWLFSLLAVLAMAAQLVVSLAPLAEASDQRMASHVENSGVPTHHAHNDATCAACQARSIHGATAGQPHVAPAPASTHDPVVLAADRIVSTGLHSQVNPRAPPALT